MRALDSEAYTDELEPLLKRVFLRDQHGNSDEQRRLLFHADQVIPFLPEVAVRLLVERAAPLDAPSLYTLAAAARSEGDRGCYLLKYWGDIDEHSTEIAYYFPAETEAEVEQFLTWYFDNVFAGLPHAVVSESAQWGLLFSGEEHVVVGGNQRFIDALTRQMGTTRDSLIGGYMRGYEVGEWVREQRHGVATAHGWVPELIAHVAGETVATRLVTQVLKRL